MNVVSALLITIMFWFVTSAEVWFAFPMLGTPIVIAPLTGLILGDFATGIIMGANLQLIFLGVMSIGGTVPPDAGFGSCIGTAFAISAHQSAEIALALAVPAAMLGSLIFVLKLIGVGLFNPLVDKYAAQGNYKGLERLMLFLGWVISIPGALIVFFTLTIGSQFAQGILESIPAVITDGLTIGAGMMPAVGIALLLRMMWSGKMAIYFFLGIILATFLHLDTFGVAAIGVGIAVIIFLENTAKSSRQSAAASVEEGLFND